MNWRKTGSNSWESTFKGKFDFAITREKKAFYVDIFDSAIRDNSEAYIETFEYDTLTEAKKDSEVYIPYV